VSADQQNFEPVVIAGDFKIADGGAVHGHQSCRGGTCSEIVCHVSSPGLSGVSSGGGSGCRRLAKPFRKDYRTLVEETLNEAPGFSFVVHSMEIEFFRPAHMDDVLEILTTPIEVKGDSISLLQQCRRGYDLLVEARVRAAR